LYRLLPQLLRQEGDHFRRIDNRWRPVDLLFLQQSRTLLRDVEARYTHLEAAIDELQTLIRADLYIKLLTRMRLDMRRARYVWKSDHLSFIQAVSAFYTDYGVVLRLLTIEQARGTFVEQQQVAS
jgi:hypothetical protein